MSTGTQDISITDQPARERYELAVGGELAGFVQYRDDAGALDLVHTEVLPAFEGRGLAGRVAQFALDDARRQGRKVVPTCSYIARYIERHSELRDLVAGVGR
jgi:uncharacterized protein